MIPHHVELGITLAGAKRWADAKVELEKGLALPTGWVTDDYYRALARGQLVRVNSHLDSGPWSPGRTWARRRGW